MITIQEVFFQVLRELGTEWLSYHVSELRNNIEHINIFVNVNRLIQEGVVNASDLKGEAPEFCSVYESVMLRDIQETIPYGDDS